MTVEYDATLKAASTGVFTQGTTDVDNTATADSDETDPLSDSETVAVTTAANLTIDKSVSSATASPGDTVHYTITVGNDGDAPANNVTLVDDYDQSLIASLTNTTGGGNYNGSPISWTLATPNP